ncbi:MAG TPA: cob(I)yrinic acid a,c-diamide adenosyltransferase [Fimbriimonadaceae bacterium]
MKIYTKTGDSGSTGLVGGSRIEKGSPRITAIGEVDELNAALGVVRVAAGGADLAAPIAKIQNLLFELGAELATPLDSKFKNEGINQAAVDFLEKSIDLQNESLPQLRNFILPGGSELAARLHLARCICRRSERAVLALHKQEQQRDVTLIFLNRLSDWLFVAARTANRLEGVEDINWMHPEN